VGSGRPFGEPDWGAATYPFLQRAFGHWVTSTDLLAAAMLELAMVGSEKKTLNTAELNVLAARACR
jgi:hypothetical protein